MFIYSILKNILNSMKLNKKFAVLYIFCVILPLLITDSIVIKAIYEQEKNSIGYSMTEVANRYSEYLSNTVANNKTLARSLDMNSSLNEFLETDFESPYDYYDQYYNFINGSFLETLSGQNSDQITIYVDNPTILSGTMFKDLSKEYTSEWYRRFVESGKSEKLFVFYDENVNPQLETARKFMYVKRMNYYRATSEKAKIIVIEDDVQNIARTLKSFDYKYPMYISTGSYVAFTNMGDTIRNIHEIRTGKMQMKTKDSKIGDVPFSFHILNEDTIFRSAINDNAKEIVIFLIVTILLPFFMMRVIEKSIVARIWTLEKAFGSDETDTFSIVTQIEGNDEISSLMRKYNKMVNLTNTLITTVYKNKLKKQESDLARKNAELLALQSQINPHFLFNALESIRMHSLLKGENETAEMVGKLAIMERQNVEWGSDFVTIKKEMDSIEAYLYLQSYRFGERLSFDIDVEKGCENYLVPKLTIVTFVENACVHGIESKATPGWIFVRVFTKDDNLCIEVEDTGGGMKEKEVEEMTDKINNVTIESIRGKKHVGILNACLRLKMISDNKAMFKIDSEEGIGMSVLIIIPKKTTGRYLPEQNVE